METVRLSVKVRVVLEMVHWINKHIHADISSEDVTKLSGYTHWHFQKLFRAITGYTLAEYIRTTRILSVAYSLAKTDHKITHIACDHGFPTQQSLARLFRRYFDCTPSDFRRLMNIAPELYEEYRSQVIIGAKIRSEQLEKDIGRNAPNYGAKNEYSNPSLTTIHV